MKIQTKTPASILMCLFVVIGGKVLAQPGFNNTGNESNTYSQQASLPNSDFTQDNGGTLNHVTSSTLTLTHNHIVMESTAALIGNIENKNTSLSPRDTTPTDTTSNSPERTLRNTNTLPAKFATFIVREENTGARLSWTTITEYGTLTFGVERSRDGINWEKMGEVAGEGSLQQTRSYEFVDKTLPLEASLVYYRLKINDFNAEHEYSEVISLRRQPVQPSARIWADSRSKEIKMTLQDNATPAQVQIFDLGGKVVMQKDIYPSSDASISCQHFPSGMYVAVAVQGSLRMVQKVVF